MFGIRIERMWPRRSRSRLVAAATILALLGAPATGEERARPAVPVEAARVEVLPLTESVTAVGSLKSNESVVIRPEIAGRVVEISFEEGQPVDRGRLLLRLDDSVYRAELAEAEARLRLAERNYRRTEELHEQQVATARARDEAISNLEVARASVAVAQAKLDKARIHAPFAGIAGLRQVSVGDYISAGQDVVNLEDIDPIKVDFRVAERFLPAVRRGQTIEIRVDAFPGHTFRGEVYAIDPHLDVAGRSIVIRARVANPDRALRPGLFARVTLILETKPKALTVPEQAIVPRGEDQFVFTVVDGKARRTKVTTGMRRGGRVEIVKGLAGNDMVVTAGQMKIRDGAPVKIITAGKGA